MNAARMTAINTTEVFLLGSDLAMAFAQFTYRESLRDIEASFESKRQPVKSIAFDPSIGISRSRFNMASAPS
jgi:hypothetical protein